LSQPQQNRAAADHAPAAGRLAIFIPGFGDGGVERMLVNTARGISEAGRQVDFILRNADAPYLEQLPAAVRVIETGPGDSRAQRAQLVDYLRRTRPTALLSAKIADDQIALTAKALAGGATRVYLRPGTALLSRMRQRGTNPLARWLKTRHLRRLLSQADGIVAVSEGVADEVRQILGAHADAALTVIRNPNITPEFYQLAQQPVQDDWFATGAPPVVLGVGGLRTQKDFPTLLRAFALLRRQRPCRLVILGQGRQSAQLQHLARQLGVAEDFRLLGFQANPYPFLAAARLFVLSSLWEGSPNVLTEALALGTPAVATDCPSGPAEISQDGRYCRLVPMRDPASMADAMAQTLQQPPEAAWLQQAVQEYRMETSARHYIRVLGL
jgi:glycosyltransferase involved in cell wall biosynthesis